MPVAAFHRMHISFQKVRFKTITCKDESSYASTVLLKNAYVFERNDCRKKPKNEKKYLMCLP